MWSKCMSAQLITNYEGDEYERHEYTPYGEVWVEKASVASNIDIPYRFTGKERDEKMGLYYYGARYLDAKTSRWMSTDPALGEYIPGAPINDEVKKANQNLPGMGGIYNYVNLHLYHYAGNNPVKYTDPDGRALETPWDVANAILGFVSGTISLTNGDYLNAGISYLGALADTAAVLFPGVPGGVSTAIKKVQYGTGAYGAIENIVSGIMNKDVLSIGIGVLQVVGMGLGKEGSKYLEYASDAFERVKLVPRSMKMGFIASGIRNKHMGMFLKAMAMAGISADVIQSSLEEFNQWLADGNKVPDIPDSDISDID